MLSIYLYNLLLDGRVFDSYIEIMKKKNEESMKKTTIRIPLDAYKKIAHYCIDNDVNVQDFLKMAALHWIDHKINLKKD